MSVQLPLYSVSDTLRMADAEMRAYHETYSQSTDQALRIKAANAIAGILTSLPDTIKQWEPLFGAVPARVGTIVKVHAMSAEGATDQLQYYPYGNMFERHSHGNMPNYASSSILEKLADEYDPVRAAD